MKLGRYVLNFLGTLDIKCLGMDQIMPSKAGSNAHRTNQEVVLGILRCLDLDIKFEAVQHGQLKFIDPFQGKAHA